MIITDTLSSKALVSTEHLGVERRSAVADALRKEVIAVGASHGVIIRPQSVHISEGQTDDAMLLEVIGEWAPDPTEGVALVGGILDGSIEPIGRGDHVRPPARRLFPVPPRLAEYSTETLITSVGAESVAVYRLAGIDSEHDRWVYEAEVKCA
ncbi:hypothetical protein EV379_1231 [Microterricola gilva]|uniref:Uncharacterized protein n=1 Tax=Microterricola gilva TaxID=393267 RepID=A0A4Q8AK89_9MICO|nr:hypothetical protein [Microterricola gilva]RZU64920.1 hypothetical protein EV379_1231 [Microterricola gilva]